MTIPALSARISAAAIAFSVSALLSGCANTYQVSTFDGKTYQTKSVPQLDGADYRFLDADGETVSLPYVTVKSLNRM